MPRRKDTEIYEYKLKSGKTRFGFKTYIGINKETGKSVKVTRQGFKTRKEASQAKIKIKAEGTQQVKKHQNEKNNAKTFKDIWKIWLPIYRQSVRGSTIRVIKNYWSYNIEPEFGNVHVNSISVNHVQEFVNEMSSKYVDGRVIINLLRRIIKFAIIRGWSNEDPFAKVIVPKASEKGKRNKNNYFEKDQLEDFLATAKECNLKIYTYFLTLGSLGLRIGEALGLKWSDIDTETHTIHIQRTVKRDEYGNRIVGPPKTKSGNRVLSISDNLYSALEEYKKIYYHPYSEFIFCRQDGEIYGNSTPDSWIRTVYKHNKDLKVITPHGFRHTLATLMYEGSDKINPKDVQYQLGHESPDLALDIYTHITEKQKENIKDSINNLNLK